MATGNQKGPFRVGFNVPPNRVESNNTVASTAHQIKVTSPWQPSKHDRLPGAWRGAHVWQRSEVGKGRQGKPEARSLPAHKGVKGSLRLKW